MKADIIILNAVGKGGFENVVNMVLAHLESMDWDVRVIQFVWGGYEWVDRNRFYSFDRSYGTYNLETFVDDYRQLMIDNGTPDVVLAAGAPYMCYVAKKAALQLDAKYKVISWLHNPLERYEMAGYGGYDALALADVHFAISAMIAGGIRQNLPGSLVIQVRNPVKMAEPDVSSTRQACPGDVSNVRQACSGNARSVRQDCTGDSRHTLLFIGRIDSQKRPDIIINALARVNGTYVNSACENGVCENDDCENGACENSACENGTRVNGKWNLRVVGSSDDKEYIEMLKELAAVNGVSDCIQWLGWQENPWDYADGADFFVIASDYEGFCLTAVEALSHGIPVITTPVGGTPEIVVAGKNGYIFPCGDDSALAEVLTAISAGVLPAIDPDNCVSSVTKYSADSALSDFEHKLREVTLHPDSVMRCEGITEAP